MEYLATFPNQMQAVEYARALSARGIPHRLMPRPRTLEASCGTAVRFSSRLPAETLRTIAPVKALYRVEAVIIRLGKNSGGVSPAKRAGAAPLGLAERQHI